jgi:hypothetical protein
MGFTEEIEFEEPNSETLLRHHDEESDVSKTNVIFITRCIRISGQRIHRNPDSAGSRWRRAEPHFLSSG